MAASSIPSTEPQSFSAGVTTVWRRGFGNFAPADGWTLRYYLRGPGALNVGADGSGSDYVVTLKADDTKTAKPGTYQWAAYAERGTGPTFERYEFDRGVMTITPNLVTAVPGDLEDPDERMIRLITCVLEGRITDDVQQEQMDGRMLVNIPLEELRKFRKSLKRKVWRKRNGNAIGQTLKVSFRRGC